MSNSDPKNEYYQSYVCNEIPANNKYVKEPKDYEIHCDIANKVFEAVDRILCQCYDNLEDYAKKFPALVNENVSYETIMTDLFGDERNGHITKSVEDALNIWEELIDYAANHSDNVCDNTDILTHENLVKSCEFIRAFGN